jgi:hypothetical protein
LKERAIRRLLQRSDGAERDLGLVPAIAFAIIAL